MHMSTPTGHEINFLKTIFTKAKNSCRTKDTIDFPIANNLLQIKKL